MVDDAEAAAEGDAGDGEGCQLALLQFLCYQAAGNSADAQPGSYRLPDAFCVIVGTGDVALQVVLVHDMLKEVAGAAAFFPQDKGQFC